MQKLTELQAQVLLVAKRHYETDGTITRCEILRRIISKVCGLDYEYVKEKDVLRIAASVFAEFVKHPYQIEIAIYRIFDPLWVKEEHATIESAVESLLGALFVVHVGDVGKEEMNLRDFHPIDIFSNFPPPEKLKNRA